MDTTLKAIFFACATVALSTPATAGTVTGTVTYLERMALPPNAKLTVRLLDVSRADAPSEEISTKAYALDGVPQTFSLEYDDNIIDPRFTYTVDAKIELSGKLLFRSTSAYPVVTRDAPNEVDIVVQKMSAASNPLQNTSWVVSSIDGMLIVADRFPMVEFGQDGAFAINTTCNNLGGEAQIGDATITFPTSMPTTMMACIEPYNGFEVAIREALLKVTGFRLTETHLAFENDAGVVVMDMNKAE